MKMLARSYVWWSKLDNNIEHLAKNCTNCQATGTLPPKAPLHPWEYPAQPWSHLHIDFAGSFLGHRYLVVVDAYSKCLSVELMQSITAEKTIQILCKIFATHGIPLEIVTDNSPTFCSEQFQFFTKYNGIKHIFFAPYHPLSNGLVERTVQTIKQGLCQMQGPEPIQDKLSKFLFKYRITPHTTTGIPPCDLLMNRCLRSRLDMLHPESIIFQGVENKQLSQKIAHDNHKLQGEFSVGDTVYAENFTASTSHQKWKEGVITEVTGPLSYKVKLTDGNIVCRHVDSVKQRIIPTAATETSSEFEEPTIKSTATENGQSQLVSSTPRIFQPPEQSELTGLRQSTRI